MIQKEKSKIIPKKNIKKTTKEDPLIIIDKCYLIKELMESTRIDSSNTDETKWIPTFSNVDCDKLKLILEGFLKQL